jgi:phosphatidylinositol alpha-mannosyltransferase
MAAGAPVVASNIEGYSSVISHDREGLLVQPKDDAKLADALGSLLARPDHRRRLAAQARASVEQFDWEVVASRVMDYYQSLLKQRTPASA